MNDNIIARLREHPTFLDTRSCREAADEIERNRATLHMQATLIDDKQREIERLREKSHLLKLERDELVRHEEQLHANLGAILGSDTSLVEAAARTVVEVERQAAEIERLKKACELYRQASIQSHRGHVRPRHPELQGDWDPTGKWGAGCPECDRASQLRSEAEAALKEEDTHEMAWGNDRKGKRMRH